MPYKRTAKGYKSKVSGEKMGENMLAQISTWGANIRMSYQKNEESGDEGVILTVLRGGRTVSIGLTDLTEIEHNALREFLTLTLDTTLPIVQAKDKAAKDAWDIDGDDTHYRQYRGAPQVVVRERALREHAEGCRKRSAYVPRVDREEVNSTGGGGDGGSGVAEGTPSPGSPDLDPPVPS